MVGWLDLARSKLVAFSKKREFLSKLKLRLVGSALLCLLDLLDLLELLACLFYLTCLICKACLIC